MSNIMPLTQWMNMTHGGYLSVRSSELKALDDALARYHRTNAPKDKQALILALTTWMEAQKAKGANWKTSVRNKNRAVDILWSQLTGIGQKSTEFSDEELEALIAIRDESRLIVKTLFRDKRVIWKKDFTDKLATEKWGVRLGVPGALRDLNTVSGGALVSGAQAVGSISIGLEGHGRISSMLRSIIPDDVYDEVMAEILHIMPNFMEELVASMLPVLGPVKAGTVAVFSTAKALYNQWQMEWGRHYMAGSLMDGAPADAMNAVIRILQREQNKNAFEASTSVAEFAGKLAGTLADGGTATNAAIGLAAGLTRLLNIVRIVVRDVREKRAANRLMREERLDSKVFDVCPIIGAYMIVCAPASVLCNTVFDSTFGQRGWQDQVENAVRRFHIPMKETAMGVINKHRFHIPQLNDYAGIMATSSKKLAKMRASMGKTTMEAMGWYDESRGRSHAVVSRP
jgi:hypothetical protein